MRALVDELDAHTETFAAPMIEPDRQEHHFASANLARSRDPEVRSIRRAR